MIRFLASPLNLEKYPVSSGPSQILPHRQLSCFPSQTQQTDVELSHVPPSRFPPLSPPNTTPSFLLTLCTMSRSRDSLQDAREYPGHLSARPCRWDFSGYDRWRPGHGPRLPSGLGIGWATLGYCWFIYYFVCGVPREPPRHYPGVSSSAPPSFHAFAPPLSKDITLLKNDIHTSLVASRPPEHECPLGR